MQPPDVTNDPAEWEQVKRSKTDAGEDRKPLWKNLVHDNVYSTDGGETFTISTERVDPVTEREVRQSRKV